MRVSEGARLGATEVVLVLCVVLSAWGCRPENEAAANVRSLQLSLQARISGASASVHQEGAQRVLVTLEVDGLSQADSVRAAQLSKLVCSEVVASKASMRFDTVKVLVWTDRALGLPIPFGYSFVRGEGCPDRGESPGTLLESATSGTSSDE